MREELERKIRRRQARIAVLGLGYVGLPLAVSFAKKGFQVLGLDKDADRVMKVVAGESYILDIPQSLLTGVVSSGHLDATTDFSRLGAMDVVIICVPTPLKRKYTPDISFIIKAVRELARHVKPGTLVVLESTTYPGTTRELIKPELEKSGLAAGRDLFLAFSPERIDPGNTSFDVTRIPKVVGGLDEAATRLTMLLYRTIIKSVYPVSSPEAAEMTKLLENSFRIINIGWINEVAMMCETLGIDVWEVIEAAKTKPFGFMPFYPGLGVGGHCIPEDPLYLYWKAKRYGFDSRYIKLSADTNARMPAYVVGRVERLMRDRGRPLSKSRILVVGVTYKKDVKDLRKSPALKLIALLEEKAGAVDYHDPLIPYLEIFNIHQKTSVALTPARIRGYDCVVIATDHSSVDYARLLRSARCIFDTRNVYGRARHEKVIKL